MALTSRNIIVGAARLFLGPSTSAADTTNAPTALARNSRPAFVAGQSYVTTLTAATYNAGTDPTAAASWREVGYTQNGLEVANNPSWGEVQVDQLLDSAKIFKDTMTFNVTTTLAENTLENILVAWGQAASSLTTSGSDSAVVIQGGSLGSAPLERGLIAVGSGIANTPGSTPTQKELVYQLYRVLSVDAVSATYARSEAAVLPCTFRCLPADDGNYGILRERAGNLT